MLLSIFDKRVIPDEKSQNHTSIIAVKSSEVPVYGGTTKLRSSTPLNQPHGRKPV